ncbi:hypothetical protein [Gordonia sp. 'Campus']|uniref:hypothetical protein n=1 Tax=Gordonia sp. 'Campus' TaxID=2915824 RepID=UPI001EE3E016|nr:hypothetical protein [Gordonia sp. 'Campus']
MTDDNDLRDLAADVFPRDTHRDVDHPRRNHVAREGTNAEPIHVSNLFGHDPAPNSSR